jgi:hypothetical protein
MQLVAYGAQDIYLTGNPQITFFKVVYRRHTNFSCESIEQTFNGTVDFGKRVTATISRNGDLIKGMWLEMQVTVAAAVADYGFGNAIVKTAELEIGGQLIDRHYGEWMDIWTELSVPEGKRAIYDAMVGNTTAADPPTGLTIATHQLDVPLQFWFCRNPGLALPLIALQYHEVKLVLELNTAANLALGAGSSVSSALSCKLYVDYVFLDTDERRRFAQISHEYLIEQVQFTGDESVAASSSSKKIDLAFNHPCKELIWVHHASSATLLDFGNTHLMTSALLQLNGHDRFSERRAEYFSNVQQYMHHTHGARQGQGQTIYCYSFALQPEEHQPSGTCNFSRIDNATLTLKSSGSAFTAGVFKVFAVNYNVLRIMSGMGGLAYSN